MAPPSPRDGEQYLWWCRGTEDEAKARNEGLSKEARELRDLLEGIAQLQGQSQVATFESLITAMARIAAPHVLKRKYRR